jgi:Ras-related GTP-binding protein C/D
MSCFASPISSDFPGEAADVEIQGASKVDAIVYVIDAQEDWRKSTITEICALFEKARQYNENILLELFINKIDGEPFASEDIRVELQQQFQSQISQEMQGDFSIHLTSVYNPSIYEAWSLVIQKLIPNQQYIVELLDTLVEICKMEKAFLFDVKTRLYIATDHNPVDHQTLTLCADSIDLAVGFDSVYGLTNNSSTTSEPQTTSSLAEDKSISVKVKLGNSMVLYNMQVDRNLVLVCVGRKESWADPWLIDRNMNLFKETLFELKSELSHLQQQQQE